MRVATAHSKIATFRIRSRACYAQRYLWQPDGGAPVAVFFLDIDGLLKPDDLSGIFVRLFHLSRQMKEAVRGFCVVNHQRHLEPSRRQEIPTLDEGIQGLLVSCGLTLAFASDLASYTGSRLKWRVASTRAAGRRNDLRWLGRARLSKNAYYLFGARDHGWSLPYLWDALLTAGYCPCAPPESIVAGKFLQSFPRHSAIGIELKSSLEEGCRLYVRTEDGFQLVLAESIKVGATDVKQLESGQAGLKIRAGVGVLVDGSLIYRVVAPTGVKAECGDATQ